MQSPYLLSLIHSGEYVSGDHSEQELCSSNGFADYWAIYLIPWCCCHYRTPPASETYSRQADQADGGQFFVVTTWYRHSQDSLCMYCSYRVVTHMNTKAWVAHSLSMNIQFCHSVSPTEWERSHSSPGTWQTQLSANMLWHTWATAGQEPIGIIFTWVET